MSGSAAAIPEALEEALLAKAGELHPTSGRRWTTRQIAGWLATEHGVACDHTTVATHLRRLRGERAAIWKEAFREQVLGQLPDDLDRLEILAQDAARVATGQDATLGQVLSTLDHLTKLFTAKTKAAGLGEATKLEVSGPGGTAIEVTDARALLTTRLAKLAEEPDAAPAGGAGGEPPAG